MERLEGNRVRAQSRVLPIAVFLLPGGPSDLGMGRSMNWACPPSRCGAMTVRLAIPGGDPGAVVAADDVQAQVQAGRDPCSGEDLALVDVQLVSLHCNFRIFRRE